MRWPILILPLLLAACGEPAPNAHRWFKTYQTDRSCQDSRHIVYEPPHGPTGRAHPF